jgi:hypothetical protein
MCPNCGLVNWPEADQCMRCGSSLGAGKPAVWNWYVAYCALLAALYLLVIIMGFVFLVFEPTDRDMSPGEARIMGVIFIVVGLVLFVPFASGPFLPRRPWAWIFGLVLICIGLTSACCLPAAVPLLIYWLKPDNKAYFGKV